MADPSVRDSTMSGVGDADTTLTQTAKPAGLVNGDWVYLYWEGWWSTSTAPTITWPAGFVQRAAAASSDGFQKFRVARKKITDAVNEPANYQINLNTTHWHQCQAVAIMDADGTEPEDGAWVTGTNTTGTGYPALNKTTTAKCLMLWSCCNENSSTPASTNPPTGYTEHEDANYLRIASKLQAAAGAETTSGGALSASTAKIVALVALKGASGGGASLTLGLVSETDTAPALTRTKSRAFGQATEADTAFSLTRSKAREFGLASSTEQVPSLSRSKLLAFGLTAESDTTHPLTAAKGRSLGLVAENESALTLNATKSMPLGLPVETDTVFALNLTGGASLVLGLPVTSETVPPLAPTKALTLGLITETELVHSLSRTKTVILGQPVEQDLGLAIEVAKSLVLGEVQETDLALALDIGVSGPVVKLWRHGAQVAVPLANLKVWRFGHQVEVTGVEVSGHGEG